MFAKFWTDWIACEDPDEANAGEQNVSHTHTPGFQIVNQFEALIRDQHHILAAAIDQALIREREDLLEALERLVSATDLATRHFLNVEYAEQAHIAMDAASAAISRAREGKT